MNERLLDDGELSQLQETKLKNQLGKLSWWLRFGSFILIPLGILGVVGVLSSGMVSYIGIEEILILAVFFIWTVGIVYIGWYARKVALANDEYSQHETTHSHVEMAEKSTKLWRVFAWVILPIAIILNGTMFVVVYDDYSWRSNYKEHIWDEPIQEPVDAVEAVEEPQEWREPAPAEESVGSPE